MRTQSAQYYDALYSSHGKDYPAEADRIHRLIQQYKRSPGQSLLDVACGTGKHLAYLREHYAVCGLDLDGAILDVARAQLPGVEFYEGDMRSFTLGRGFDAITCLFSAIGYVKTIDGLNQAIASMRRHLLPGGVLIVEPWFAPNSFFPGKVHALFVDQPELKIARMNVSRVENGVSIIDFHYMVATPAGVETFAERLELGLFTDEEYLNAFAACGLDTIHDAHGLDGRGLFIGVKPQ